MSVFGRWRECQITDYDSRRTGDWFSDRGSIPLRSTYKNLEKSSVYAGLRGSYFFKETGYLIDKLSIIPYTFITENIKSKGELL